MPGSELDLFSASQIPRLFTEKILVVDVRAPVEFWQGRLAGSVNLPILTDKEREVVGTAYKNQGSEVAMALGHQLVSGDIKASRVKSWCEVLSQDPSSVLMCFRGGQRSQISQRWCREAGVIRPRVEGGYKAVRAFAMQALEQSSQAIKMIAITGRTGSGKSLLIQGLKSRIKALDLEAYANHRGSAFGGYPEGQPSQATFENQLVQEILSQEKQSGNDDPFVVEDESRMIGQVVVPELFFERMRSFPVVLIHEPLESRTEVTFKDYILRSPLGDPRAEEAEALKVFARYEHSLFKILKKLGGLRYAEVLQDLQFSKTEYLKDRSLESNRVWISKLLDWYYDPLYLKSFEKRDPRVLFQGTRAEAQEFLLSKPGHQLLK